VMQGNAAELQSFADQVVGDGLSDVVLLGMGGSSLCPSVFGQMFPRREGMRHFLVLDLTDPDAVSRIERTIDLTRTLFISASKSGKTVETLSHTEYFWQEVTASGDGAGRQFVAITDEGSHLQKMASERAFRHVFVNPSDIGGRYSALSYFGLVAGALAGVPLPELLASAVAAEQLALGGWDDNPALELGLLLGTAAEAGHDKLTFIASPRMAPLVPWIEQLIAESTGKKGRGIIPIEGEPLAPEEQYGSDRLFVTMRFADEPDPAGAMRRSFEQDDIPFVEIVLNALPDIGGEFYTWEVATAIAGWVLDINPFDEPNVQESKDNTNRVLESVRPDGRLALPETVADAGAFRILKTPGMNGSPASVGDLIGHWLLGVDRSQYVSLLAYVDESDRTEEVLARMRLYLLSRSRCATLRGYGPRYLHSIGQLYKGGPPVGAFMVMTSDPAEDRSIPGVPYTFESLKLAQALGDAESIAKRNRPLLHVHLPDLLPGLDALADLIESL